MKQIRRMLSLVLALGLAAVPVLAEEEMEAESYAEEGAQLVTGYSEADALGEESALDAFETQPGDYEWYVLPAEPQDGNAYVDIYPTADPVRNADGTWSYLLHH